MERIGTDVRGALRRAGVPDAGVLAAVTTSWPTVVGPAIARAAWPLRISRDGTLHVAVSSASWAAELALLEPDIRGRLASALGPPPASPESLRFAVGPIPAPGPADELQKPSTAPPPTPEEAALAAAVASAIDDRELRELARRAAAASLAGRRSDRDV